MTLANYKFLGKKKESYFFREGDRDLKVRYHPEKAIVFVQGIGEIHPSSITAYSSKEHVCGSWDFGKSLEDSCEKCEEASNNSIILGRVRKDLVKKNLLKEKL